MTRTSLVGSVDLLSGFVRIHILHHAAEGEVYGQWMIEELARVGYRLRRERLHEPTGEVSHANDTIANKTPSSRS
jgi:PadR family transcriptional regulator PadR